MLRHIDSISVAVISIGVRWRTHGSNFQTQPLSIPCEAQRARWSAISSVSALFASRIRSAAARNEG